MPVEPIDLLFARATRGACRPADRGGPRDRARRAPDAASISTRPRRRLRAGLSRRHAARRAAFLSAWSASSRAWRILPRTARLLLIEPAAHRRPGAMTDALPIIDLTPLGERRGRALRASRPRSAPPAATLGFFYVVNHGVAARADATRPSPSRRPSSPCRCAQKQAHRDRDASAATAAIPAL